MKDGCPFLVFHKCAGDKCCFYFDPENVNFLIDGEQKQAVFPGLKVPCLLYITGRQTLKNMCQDYLNQKPVETKNHESA